MGRDAPAVERVGRYAIVGEVGRGGMAEILLGRAAGRSGFERLAVVKRILPELARRPAFVSMFLDEARTLARIHHPNVVQVYELGDSADELYLAMEYLEGENAGGVLRRLVALGRSLPDWLAAHVVIEACRGLHAAHELTHADGRPLGLVHRDVSLQNVFVTYRGEVKLLDFGVAYVADRSEATEAGQVKGKHAYMSPEQCRGEPLDRRSDVFAMGIVLYELLTGTRLYKRATDHLTFEAICDEPAPPPSALLPGGDTSFDAVCAKALAKRKQDRHESAEALRRDLADAMRTRVSAELTVDRADAPEAVANLMRSLFEDRIAEKEAMLRDARAGESGVVPVPGDADLQVELPTTIEPGFATATPIARASGRVRHRRRFAIAVGVALAATGAIAVALRFAPKASPETRSVAAAPTAHVTVRVETTPSGARVVLDGEPMGVTPLSLELARSEERKRLSILLDGYGEASEEISAATDQRLVLALEPLLHTAPSVVHSGAPPVSVPLGPSRPTSGTQSSAAPQPGPATSETAPPASTIERLPW